MKTNVLTINEDCRAVVYLCSIVSVYCLYGV